MEKTKREVVIYIATSLDGYIARQDGDITWLSAVEREGEDYGYAAFMEQVDTVVIGRKTYDKVLEMGMDSPYPGKKLYVLSRDNQTEHERVEYYQGGIPDLIASIRAEEGLKIYCDGGAEAIRQFVRNDLIDRYIISVIPILLGDGIRLFQQGLPNLDLKQIRAQSYPSGLVQLEYERVRNENV